MVTVSDLVGWLKRSAPLDLAEEWDNVGLLVGQPAQPVSRVLTCLTLTEDVVDEAVSMGVQLVITHHPLLFKPMQKLTDTTSEGRILIKLIRAGIGVYSAHTAYDSAPDGVNAQLAQLFQLQNVRPLRPLDLSKGHSKVVTFVPPSALSAVQQAVWSSGAGEIGEYRNCSFYAAGEGTFQGSANSHPAIGKAGRLETTQEFRVEFLVPDSHLAEALAALRKGHPYEEPAIDVFALKSAQVELAGAGRYGELPAETTLSDFAQRTALALSVPTVEVVGSPKHVVRRVAIACGAAASFQREARRAGCDLLLTGEARFHERLEARSEGLALIVAGHYATERPAVEVLAHRIGEAFPGIRCQASAVECDPSTFFTFL